MSPNDDESQLCYDSAMKQKVFRQTKAFLVTKIVLIDIPLMMFLIGFITLPIRILRYFNARLVLKEKVISLEGGVINKGEIEIPYSKINSVSVKQGLLGKMLDYGDISITTGNDISGIPFSGVKSPHKVKQLISQKLSR